MSSEHLPRHIDHLCLLQTVHLAATEDTGVHCLVLGYVFVPLPCVGWLYVSCEGPSAGLSYATEIITIR
jgi:hypothetical protein